MHKILQKTKYTPAIMALLSFATTAFARVGGGQDYVDTSSGGSSGGGFSFGGGSIVSVVIFLGIVYGIFYVLKKKGINIKNPMSGNNPLSGFGNNKPGNTNNNPLMNNSVQQDLRRGNVEGALFNAAMGMAAGSILSGLGKQFGGMAGMGGGVDIQGELTKIKAADPGFNEEVFKDKAQTAFFKLQEGWERQDLSIMRPFVSDPVLSRYSNQLADMKSRGEKDVMENIVVGHMDITDVKSDASFNYITVKIDASAADYTLNSSGAMVKGSKTPKGFTEYWTFLRTVGVKSDPNKQLKDNKCPNCGAALQVNATGKCDYCGAVITSGQYDWVLSDIRQV
jgi:predicted lipid-binding transport protein (Tim44 family)